MQFESKEEEMRVYAFHSAMIKGFTYIYLKKKKIGSSINLININRSHNLPIIYVICNII